MTWLCGGTGVVDPGGDTAIDESIAVISSPVDLGIIGPALRSGFRIESNDPVERGGQIKCPVYQDGSGFKSTSPLLSFAVGNIAGVKHPGNFEAGNIFAIDLCEWRVAHAARVVSVGGPVIRRTP